MEEVNKYLASKRYYVGVDGKFSFSANTATVEYVLRNMTGAANPNA